jgi:phosphohistidine phosphatase
MRLTLIRHAIAEEGADDAARALSKEGRKRFRREVEALEALGVRFSRVLHSPKRRAVETAELLRPLVGGELVEVALLAHAPSEELFEAMTGDDLALVGHEPHLSTLLAMLVSGDRTLGARVELKKGAVAMLEGEPRPGGMALLALLPPKVLRSLER